MPNIDADQGKALLEKGIIDQPTYDKMQSKGWWDEVSPQVNSLSQATPVDPTTGGQNPDYEVAKEVFARKNAESAAEAERRSQESKSAQEAALHTRRVQAGLEPAQGGQGQMQLASASSDQMITPKMQMSPEEIASDRQKEEQQQPASNGYDQFMQGYNTMQDATRQMQAAAIAKGNSDAANLQQYQKEQERHLKWQQDHEALTQQTAKGYQDQIGQAIDKYSKMAVDPHKMWHDMSTGSKITAGIALALGAFGAAGGGGNKAVEIIDKAIDTDLAAQRSNIEKQGAQIGYLKSAYKDSMDILHDESAGKAAQLLTAYNVVQNQIAQTAAKYSGTEAAQKANMLYGEIENKKTDLKMQLQQSAFKQAAMQNPEQLSQYIDPKERELIVPGYGIAYDPKSKEDFRTYLTNAQPAMRGIKRLLEINSKSGKSMNIDLRTEAGTLQSLVAASERLDILGPGTVQDSERALLKELIADPTKLGSLDRSNQIKLQAILDRLENGIQDRAKLTFRNYKTPNEKYGQTTGVKASEAERPKAMIQTSYKGK